MFPLTALWGVRVERDWSSSLSLCLEFHSYFQLLSLNNNTHTHKHCETKHFVSNISDENSKLHFTSSKINLKTR